MTTGVPSPKRFGLGGGGAISFYSGSPNGVLTGALGQLVIDSTTGNVYTNLDGATTWTLFTPFTNNIGAKTYLREDFISITLLTGSVIGAGSQANSGEVGHPGISTTSQAVAGVDGYRWASTNTALTLSATEGGIRAKMIARIPVLSDGTNNVIVRGPTGDGGGLADATDGIYFEYDFGTYGDHAWRLCSSNNSTRTKVTTGIVPVANTWQELEWNLDAAGTSITGKIGGVACPTAITTNIPLARTTGMELKTSKQLGAGALSVGWDAADIVMRLARDP